jgi:hypothetical protein
MDVAIAALEGLEEVSEKIMRIRVEQFDGENG